MLPSYPSGIADHKGVCRQIVANPSDRVTTGGDSQQSTHSVVIDIAGDVQALR
jgi:hypothetical protein